MGQLVGQQSQGLWALFIGMAWPQCDPVAITDPINPQPIRQGRSLGITGNRHVGWIDPNQWAQEAPRRVA
jgi:hypothetical protein